MSRPARPIPESYWVIPGRFLAGEHPGGFTDEHTRERLDAFLAADFDTFIDLTLPAELPSYFSLLKQRALTFNRRIDYRRHPIEDFGVPQPARMLQTLQTLEAALQEGRQLYLHCRGGVGRTGMTVGCYLVQHGYTGDQALNQLQEWWREVPKSSLHPRSPETEAQMQFILDWPA